MVSRFLFLRLGRGRARSSQRCAVPLLAEQLEDRQLLSRNIISMDNAWQFLRQDVAGAEAVSYNDAAWTAVTLPHTWNNLDGQDGGNNYYRGTGWYRTHYTPDNSYAGRRFFLKFDGAFYVTDVYLNGNFLGEHQGGMAAFVFDATPFINVGADN